MIIALLGCGLNTFAQDAPGLLVGGYIDGYYSWYDAGRPGLIAQHDCIGARHDVAGLNIAQMTVGVHFDRLRGTGTLHFGDIPNITWSGPTRPVQEGYAGVRLANKLWLDMGFFKTHVGTESFLPKDNIISIISLGTYYGPFYQGGVRLSYDFGERWHSEWWLINGYNQHADNNNHKSYGILLRRSFGERTSLSYSNMLGIDEVGTLRHDYLVYQSASYNFTGEKWSLQAGLDVATAYRFNFVKPWEKLLVAALFTARRRINEQFAVAGRAELFRDPGMINSIALVPDFSPSNVTYQIRPDGFNVFGATISMEYKPAHYGFLRLESRALYDTHATSWNNPRWYNDRAMDTYIMPKFRLQALITAGFYFNSFWRSPFLHTQP